MQRKMQELFLQQKEKGGIIDLEEEGRKYLVVTNSPTSPDQTFTELSPTDYQLGKYKIYSQQKVQTLNFPRSGGID